jgi:molybdopterin synthase catalytic subunit
VRWLDASRAPLPFVPVHPPAQGETWLALTAEALPVAAAYDWCVRPDCGAVVLFSGTVRDHAEGRSGVAHLTYEAYEEQVLPRLEAIAAEIRRRWPRTGRIALLHRIGRLELGESSVIVAASAPHRAEAFAAARFGIDTLKETVPIWKQETWEGGRDWALGAHELTDVASARDARREAR